MDDVMAVSNELPQRGLAVLKYESDDFPVEFDVLPAIERSAPDPRMREIYGGLACVDRALLQNEEKINVLYADIDRLTNHADGLDYMVAVGSGIIAGIIDVVWVGEFSFERANAWGKEKVDNFVIKIAKMKGYDKDDLQGAVTFLEKNFPHIADKATPQFGGGLQHHLRDFSHHASPVGLIFSLLTQFTGKVYGTDTAGHFLIVDVKDLKGIDGEILRTLMGKDIPEKIMFGAIHWFYHMVSDMAGSSGSINKEKLGTGVPGPLLSLLKELSVLPIFSKTYESGYNKGRKELSVWISKLFNGTLLGEKGKPLRFDLRTEIGVLHELSRQAVPVIVNECIVRAFYFIRQVYQELKEKDIKRVQDLSRIDWGRTLPVNNRTVNRMLTISTGTMTAIDLADAYIRGAAKSGGVPTPDMLLRVNFVGLGRFVIAVGADVFMGMQRDRRRAEVMTAMNERLYLMQAKIYYRQAEMWIAAEDAGQAIISAYEMIDVSLQKFTDDYRAIKGHLGEIARNAERFEAKNSGVRKELVDIMRGRKRYEP